MIYFYFIAKANRCDVTKSHFRLSSSIFVSTILSPCFFASNRIIFTVSSVMTTSLSLSTSVISISRCLALYRHLKPDDAAELPDGKNFVVVDSVSSSSPGMPSGFTPMEDFDTVGNGITFLVKRGVTENVGSINLEVGLTSMTPGMSSMLKSFEFATAWSSGKTFVGGKKVDECVKVTKIYENENLIKIELLHTFSGDSVNVNYNYVLDNAGAEMPNSGLFSIGCAVFDL